MNISSLYIRRRQNRGRLHLWQQTALICLLLFLIGGCASYRQQIRTYISGQEQDVAFALRQVMLASGKGLTELHLTISRIELIGPGGVIQAHGPDREATLSFRSIDQRHTHVHIDVFTEKRARDISSEEALSRRIPALITDETLPSLDEITGKMIPVHQAPHPGSRIIGYLAGGTVVSIASVQNGFNSVVLLSGGTGYVASRNIRPVPKGTAMNIPEV